MRARGHALDAADEGIENRRAYTVARGRRRRMCAVTVDVACRHDLAIIDRARRFGTADKPARANKFVIAVINREILAALAFAVPVFRCFK